MGLGGGDSEAVGVKHCCHITHTPFASKATSFHTMKHHIFHPLGVEHALPVRLVRNKYHCCCAWFHQAAVQTFRCYFSLCTIAICGEKHDIWLDIVLHLLLTSTRILPSMQQERFCYYNPLGIFADLKRTPGSDG